jgi:O-antigen ligase
MLGLAAAFVISPRKSRLLGALVGVAAVVVALVVVSQGGALRSAKPVLSRFATIKNPSAVRSEASLKQRSVEDHLAWTAIRQNPITGIGWGTSYGMSEPVVVRGQTIGQADQPFIHNFYLGLWMRTGLLGLAAYLTAVVAALVYGVRWCRRPVWDDQSWLGLAVVSSIVAVSTSAVVNVGSDAQKIIPFMVVLALAVTLRRELPPGVSSAGHG